MASETKRGFCTICAPCCGVLVTVDGEQVTEVRGDPGHPISQGYTCPKGRALGDIHHDPRRLDRPMLRRGGELRECGWEEALDDLAALLAGVVEEHGPDAVAVYQGTPALHETIAQPSLGKLFHKLGSRSRYSSLTVDIAAKLAVTPMVLGAPLLPVVDTEDTSLLVVLGTNPVVSHGQYNGFSDPVTRLRAIAERGELWVIDPRLTETAAQATTHVYICPGTDHALLAFLVRDILRRGVAADVASRLQGLETLDRLVQPWDPQHTASVTGIPPRTLRALADAVDRAGRFSLLTGTGVTMAASANVSEWLALAALLLTDSLDRPGGMWFNPGHTFPADKIPIPVMAASDGRPGPSSRPDLPRFMAEHPCAALADEIEAGNVKVLLSFGGNPLVAIAEPDRLRRAISSLDAFVVLGTHADSQVELATHVLPAAGGLERSELLLSSQSAQLRVISQYTPAMVPPQFGRRPSWWAVGQLAKRLGHDVLPGRIDVDVATEDDLMAAMVGGPDVLRTMVEVDGPLVGEQRVTGWALDALPFDRFDLVPAALVEQFRTLTAAAPPDGGPRLIPRRRLRMFNSVGSPSGRQEEQEVLVHPEVADAAGVREGDHVRVSSDHGVLIGPVVVTERISPGAVAASHGHVESHVGRLASTGQGVDPISGQITQTGIPVRIERQPVPDR
jgi:anaerobic selenocysteine-containing dehydrogenase